MLIQTPFKRNSVFLDLMIFISFNWANLCILAKIHSYLYGSTLTIQEIPRPSVYRIVEQTLRSSRLFSRT